MRLPAYQELSREQAAVCILAPLDKPILVTGPPGTGKTVIAFYRAEAAQKQKQLPRVVMKNRVLMQFASSAADSCALVERVSTWDSWFFRWGRSVRSAGLPQSSRWKYDWSEVLKVVAETPPERRYKAPWGHLILDEGQDFPKEFFALARFLCAGCKGRTDNPVMITVFADENQRLHPDANSTIREIRDNLGVPPERCYTLTRNWRNTREVAAFASYFFCGLSTGMPVLPEDRRGEVPAVRRTAAMNEAMDHIARYVILNDDIEVAVFTPTVGLQASVFNKLVHRLKDHKSVRVQQYTSDRTSAWNDETKLSFGVGGTVTVLCVNSSKGLEFDAVFIPELQTYRCDPSAEDRFKMDFYVMCSRARRHLCLLYTVEPGEQPEILKRLPPPGDARAEWINA